MKRLFACLLLILSFSSFAGYIDNTCGHCGQVAFFILMILIFIIMSFLVGGALSVAHDIRLCGFTVNYALRFWGNLQNLVIKQSILILLSAAQIVLVVIL